MSGLCTTIWWDVSYVRLWASEMVRVYATSFHLHLDLLLLFFMLGDNSLIILLVLRGWYKPLLVLNLNYHLVWRLYYGSHLYLHLLEVIDELVFTLVLNVTHLLPNLLLQRSVAV